MSLVFLQIKVMNLALGMSSDNAFQNVECAATLNARDTLTSLVSDMMRSFLLAEQRFRVGTYYVSSSQRWSNSQGAIFCM